MNIILPFLRLIMGALLSEAVIFATKKAISRLKNRIAPTGNRDDSEK